MLKCKIQVKNIQCYQQKSEFLVMNFQKISMPTKFLKIFLVKINSLEKKMMGNTTTEVNSYKIYYQ